MLRQSLQQKLLQKLSPQQIQLMKMLQLPTVALEARIKEELESNPALDEGRDQETDEFDSYDDEQYSDEYEEPRDDFDFSEYMDDDTPDYKLYASNRGADDEEREMPLSVGSSYHEVLEAQLGLRLLSDEEMTIARHLIGNIDEAGYLRRELDAIVDDLAFTMNIMTDEAKLEALLKVIHEFDPPGSGARTLQECLLIQLRRKEQPTEATEIAIEVLEEHFESFTKKHYSKIIKRLDITEDDLRAALDEVLKLNPKPGNSLSDTHKVVEHIVPDFTVRTEDGQLELLLNNRNMPELRISRKYSEMLEAYMANKAKATKAEKDALTFVKQKLDSARWFIDAIAQRYNTLEVTMEAIMDMQREYFQTGDETKLKPMILKDVAEQVGLDISTISRVANSKYVQTPYGTFLVKTFFSESLSTESGEEVSTREVKKILQDLIGEEDKRKPITDEKLAQALKEKGYNIARRTVAKYREQLGIPVARLRKEI